MRESKKDLAAAWKTAIGLQAADGLSASDYLRQIAQKCASGIMSVDEARTQLDRYYAEKNANDAGDPEKEEADKVAANVAKVLLANRFDLSIKGLSTLYSSIFDGIFENAGAYRENEVSKREWVLGGDSVSFTKAEDIRITFENAIRKERNYNYDANTQDDIITHLTDFVSSMWKICAFGEGNTRFAAVLTILYLRKLGIETDNEIFANYSWYFHNALARATYRNVSNNIDYAPVYLERFFRNLILDEQWDLRNRYVHVRPAAEWSEQPRLKSNLNTGQVKVKKSRGKIQEEEKKDTTILQEKELAVEDNVDNPNIQFLAVVIGDRFLSIKEIMEGLQLKGRDNFLKLYLTPALKSGLVRPLYPKAPRHPRQKYLLSSKGMEFLASIGPGMTARIEQHLAAKKQ